MFVVRKRKKVRPATWNRRDPVAPTLARMDEDDLFDAFEDGAEEPDPKRRGGGGAPAAKRPKAFEPPWF